MGVGGQFFHVFQVALNLGVKLGLMVVVVAERGMNLGEGKNRMLEMDFLWTPAVRQRARIT